MAGPSKDMQEDSSTKPAPFSYAQAAKGKSAVLTAPPKAITQEQETFSWADDSGDADTVIEESHHHDVVNGNGTMKLPESPEKPLSNGSQATTAIPSAIGSNPQSPSCGSSDATIKNDEDTTSPTKSPLDSLWRVTSRPLSPRDKKSPEESSSRKGSSAAGSRKQSTSEPPKVFKEAPPPMTNFWADRAEKKRMEAASKPKSIEPAQPAKHVETSTSSISPVAGNATSSVVRPEKKPYQPSQMQNGNASQAQEGRNTKTRSTIPAGPKAGPTSKSDAPMPPPTNDEFAWPTPLSAQGEERRNSQSKNAKPEGNRNTVSTTSHHGKDKWQAIPITPSVIFPTAAIPTGGRGVRPGVQGAPGVPTKKRPPRQIPTNETSADGTGANGKTSSTPSTAQSNNAKTVFPSGDLDKAHDVSANSQRRSSFQSGRAESKRSSQRDQDIAQDSGSSVVDLSHQSSIPQSNGATTSIPPPSPSQLNGAAQEYSVPQTKPAASQAFSPQSIEDTGLPGYNDKRKDTQCENVRGGFETSSRRGKRASPETRSRAPSAGHESQPFLPSHRGGRGRGRGARGNRGDFSGPSHSQFSTQSGLPPLQTSHNGSHRGASSANPAFATSPAQDRKPYRNSSHRMSLPADSGYARSNAPFSPYMQYPQMYEYGMNQASPMQFPSQMEQYMVYQGVATQLSYYFSLENLLKDMFLRKHMDSQGFVPLTLIANFKRITDLTLDFDLIKSVCFQSGHLELRALPDGQVKVRPRRDWEKWVLTKEERDSSAQNDGPPAQHQKSFQPHSVMRSPLPYMNGTHHEADNVNGEINDMPSYSNTAPSPLVNGTSRHQQQQHNRRSIPFFDGSIPSFEPQIKPGVNGSNGAQHADEDFPNSQIPTLMLAVKRLKNKQHPNASQLPGSNRSVSNGSMEDGITAADEAARSRPQAPSTDPETPANGSTSPAAPSDRPTRTSQELYWLKGNDTAASELPTHGDPEPYLNVRARALEARQIANSSDCPHELRVLYQFWSHFLIRHFNKTMYDEFRSLAHEDVDQGRSDDGMKHLQAYYGEALSNHRTINDRVARHYVQLVQSQYRNKSSRPAFDQMKRAWSSEGTNAHNRSTITDHIDAELRTELDG